MGQCAAAEQLHVDVVKYMVEDALSDAIDESDRIASAAGDDEGATDQAVEAGPSTSGGQTSSNTNVVDLVGDD